MEQSLKESIDKFRNKLNLLFEADQPDNQEQEQDQQQEEEQTQNTDPNKNKGYEVTDKQTPANAQANVDNKAEDPGTLQLADGTDTEIQRDSTSVETNDIDRDVPPPEGEINIEFEKGNFTQLEGSVQDYSKLIQTVENTFVPLCEKALIELLGNSQSYRRVEFTGVPNLNGNNLKVDVDLKYHVDLMIGTDVDPQAVKHDQDYILDTIKPTPNLMVRNIKIDTQTGDISIGVTITE
jgi:hypothetical protein